MLPAASLSLSVALVSLSVASLLCINFNLANILKKIPGKTLPEVLFRKHDKEIISPLSAFLFVLLNANCLERAYLSSRFFFQPSLTTSSQK